MTLNKLDGKSVDIKALLDSGATQSLLHTDFVKSHNIPHIPLQRPVVAYNADNTPNVAGLITHYAILRISMGEQVMTQNFLVANIGKERAILGMDWLKQHNPRVDWIKGLLTFRGKPMQLKPFSRVEIAVAKLQASWDEARAEADRRRAQRSAQDESLRVVMSKSTAEDEEEDPFHPLEPDLEFDSADLVELLEGFKSDETPEEPPEIPALRGESWDIAQHSYARRLRSIPGRLSGRDQLVQGAVVMQVQLGKTTKPSNALASAEASKTPKKTLEELVPEIYRKDYEELFQKKSAERFPATRPWDHHINLKPDFVSQSAKPYKLSPKETEAMNAFIDENLAKGYIEPSDSPMSSSFFFVDKKDGSLRPTQDYRYLNSGTIRDQYPLPIISDLVDQAKDAQFFSKLDLRSGYNNVQIVPEDRHKAAFTCSRGLFQPKVMFFGLCNSPATFQRMMNAIFDDMITEGWLVIYMDDMLIFSKTLEEHRQQIFRVLQRLKDNDLYLKPEKCTFEARTIDFLGLVLRPGHVAMDPVKLDGIESWPEPATVKQVQSFLGFCNFYRRFIRSFAELARPLHDLTRKDAKWDWTLECSRAFQELKRRFIVAPILQTPDITQPFKMETDASKYAYGGVLSQKDDDGIWHPCAYISKGFTPAERNYDVADRELLAIIRCLHGWRHYLEGSAITIEVHTDHKNLEYFKTARDLTRRQARWALFLTRFNYQLHAIKGTTNHAADALSRRVDHRTSDNDNEAQVLLPPHLFINTITIPIDRALRDKLKAAKDRDKQVFDALETILASGPPSLSNALSDWNFDDGIIFRRGKIYVPPDLNLRREIVKSVHDTPTSGHPGRYKTTELVQREYWWPGMSVFIRNYVAGCATCQATKINTHPTVPPDHPIPHGESLDPWAVVSMDFITDLPLSHGYDSVLVAVDHDVTKGVIFMPCNKTCTAEETATLYQNNVFRHYGLPLKLISDRGPQFASAMFKELCKKLSIRSGLSTAHHPQTDGETERVNQELELYLRTFCNHRGDDWTTWLPLAEFCHNRRAHSATKQSPFHMLMGYHPLVKLPTSPYMTKSMSNKERLDTLLKIRDEAKASHDLAAEEMRRRAENPDYKPFEVGDKVWLEGKHIATAHPSAKLAPRRYGPYKVQEVLSPITFKLDLPSNLRQLHPVFHASLLTPYTETTEHGKPQKMPTPVMVEGEEEWEVEKVLNSRIIGKKRPRIEYLIKWKGIPEEQETTWTPASRMANSPEAIQEFHQHFPDAPQLRTISYMAPDPSKSPKRSSVLPANLIPHYVEYINSRMDNLVVSTALHSSL